MRKIIIPTTKTLTDYLPYSKDFIMPLKDYAVDYKKDYTLEEILKLKNLSKDINIYLVMNKPIFNKDLKELTSILKEIDKYGFKGILFYDVSILNIHKKLNLKTDLIWNNTHMVTNYKTCDFYLNEGCKYGVLSNEITLEEIKEITKNTKMKLWLLMIGYPVMAFSRRHLLKNYTTFHKLKETKSLEVKEHTTHNLYNIFENNFGTSIKKQQILNATMIIDEVKIDGMIFKEEDINHECFLKVLDLYQKYENKKITKEELLTSVTNLIGSDSNFLFNETIYQVKKDG